MEINAEDHLGLVAMIAFRFIPKGTRIHDIRDTEEFADGMLGLAHALKGYEENCGNGFCAYAGRCIFNEILDGVKKKRRRDKIVKIYYVDDFKFLKSKFCFDNSVDLKEKMRKIVHSHHKEQMVARRMDVLKRVFYEGKTQTAVSQEMEVSHERIRQLKEEGLEDLLFLILEENYRQKKEQESVMIKA